MSQLALLKPNVLWKLGITPVPPAISSPLEGGMKPDIENNKKKSPIR